MNKRNCVSGIFWICFFVYFLFLCLKLDKESAYWPKLICVIGLGLSVVSTVHSAIAQKNEKGQAAVLPFSYSQMKRITIIFALLVFWVICIEIIGFLTSSVIFMAAVFIVFEPERVKKKIIRDMVAAVIFGVLMYALFTALGITFPQGIFL